METFQVKRSGTDNLSFEGEPLAKVSTPRHEMNDGERGYELALYAESGGGLVASFEYLTTVSTEKPVHLADLVDDPKDVENFFLVIEPCEYIDNQKLDRLSKEHRAQLRKAMYTIYDGHVDVMLRALQDYLNTRKDAINQSTEKKDRTTSKRGMLSFLGFK